MTSAPLKRRGAGGGGCSSGHGAVHLKDEPEIFPARPRLRRVPANRALGAGSTETPPRPLASTGGEAAGGKQQVLMSPPPPHPSPAQTQSRMVREEPPLDHSSSCISITVRPRRGVECPSSVSHSARDLPPAQLMRRASVRPIQLTFY
ncbi:hypothetical protein AAFF_G00385420 [Aldrovandia affinis]|uniref:Uncharacterized protein n=1 Tax=Aldrovandia affinis TaxID=143900 RepID=A0AAD7SEX6_9TELE|nr:hypothetical protein AAFF_G00385420 [Aldrovandia affinis]